MPKSDNTYEALTNAVTSADWRTLIDALHAATREDIIALQEEYDLEAIAESHGEESPFAKIEERVAKILKEKANTPQPSALSPQVSKQIPLTQIDTTAIDLQIREQIDPDQIDNLREAIESKIELPPIDLFQSETEENAYYIGDGWHRLHAHREAKCKTIAAIVHPGGRAAALKHALGANADHGLRRTNRDKRNAVKIALSAFKTHSGREIARICNVTESLVRTIKKKQMEQSSTQTPSNPTDQKTLQIDFWDTFRADASEIVTGFRARLRDAHTLGRFEQEPERTAQEFESLADVLAQEARKIKATAAKIREGIAASK